MLSRAGCWSLLVCLLAGNGCAPVMKKPGTPLAKPCMSPDSVVLEIYSARFAFNDAKYNDQLWQSVDEQPLPADLRRALGEYGFRVGILQSQIPPELQELMCPQPEAAEKPAEEEGPSQPDSLEEVVVDFEEESPVHRRVLQLRAAKRGEILASGIYESWPVLENDGGHISGKPYPRGQGVLAVKSYPQPDGRVKLRLSPELHYGDPRVNYVSNQGIIRLETGRAKKLFEQLTVEATLAPGEMLLITGRPDRRGSLGHYFFTEQKGGALEQKLLIVRLAQTQHNDLFGADVAVSEEE